ncbi:hypothetical protein K438DRAFT_2029668 [Mycena galopus ATCC 62051]|nr:hypothetical protein K438DRAFT_2029668 [Mycena galopus ATCC 62051]
MLILRAPQPPTRTAEVCRDGAGGMGVEDKGVPRCRSNDLYKPPTLEPQLLTKRAHSPHLKSVAPRSLAVVSPLDPWWTFDARHSLARSTVERPQLPAVQRRDSMRASYILTSPSLRIARFAPSTCLLAGPASYGTSASDSLSATGVDARGPSSSVLPLRNVASTALGTCGYADEASLCYLTSLSSIPTGSAKKWGNGGRFFDVSKILRGAIDVLVAPACLVAFLRTHIVVFALDLVSGPFEP